MNRRKALKNIGAGIGVITLTPTVVSLFHSCQTEISYSSVFFTKNDFKIVSTLMELIIPKTDIPGAIELKLPEFVDSYIDAVYDEKRKGFLASGLGEFLAVGIKDASKEKATHLSINDWDSQLAKYLKPGNKILKEENQAAKFISELRSLTVNAFKTNEFIGENILAYAPIPGKQEGCVDLMETTGGKAWSL